MVKQELFETDVNSFTSFSDFLKIGLLLNAFGDHLLDGKLMFWSLFKTVAKPV